MREFGSFEGFGFSVETFRFLLIAAPTDGRLGDDFSVEVSIDDRFSMLDPSANFRFRDVSTDLLTLVFKSLSTVKLIPKSFNDLISVDASSAMSLSICITSEGFFEVLLVVVVVRFANRESSNRLSDGR